MALTKKQIYNRLNKCWEWHYSSYTHEAEWYGQYDGKDIEENVWICDVPSLMKSVRLTLDLDTKHICMEERKITKRDGIRSVYGEWKVNQRHWY